MPLDDAKCRNAKPKEKPYKLYDMYGLYLEVHTNGSKYWRKKYQFNGKERRHSIGVYGQGKVSLAEARKEALHISEMVKRGEDPAQGKKEKKLELANKHLNNFEALAREWYAKQRATWCDRHAQNIMARLENDVFPHIGNRPIAEIKTPEFLAVLERIEERKAYEMAKRTRQYCDKVFDYAIGKHLMEHNPARNAASLLTKVLPQNYPTITITELPDLLKIVNGNAGRHFPTTLNAFKLMVLVFLRTSELRGGKWEEVDWNKKQWLVPAVRMKGKRDHIVPLSRQALAILEAQKEIVGNSPFMFPNQHKPQKVMSENTLLGVIEKAGYKGRMVGHSFRSLSMTSIRDELGYAYDPPDIQLGHGKGDKLKIAYDKSQFLKERTDMMQDWADLVEKCGDISPVRLPSHKE